MPLSAINFVPKGPVKSADINQFFNLFTGVMVDQPVTFKNVMTVGGNQGTTTVPVKLYGAVGQTTHLLDLYTDNTNANPGWGIAASGLMAWGPGGAAPTDTTLSRVAMQNGHAADTAGLLVTPYLEVAGQISATSYLFANGATLTGPTANPLQISLNQDLFALGNVTVGGGGLQIGNSTPPSHIDATTAMYLHSDSVNIQARGASTNYAPLNALTILIDPQGLNDGTAESPGLMFGLGTTGEAISSPRTASATNRFGLNFYTGSNVRLTLDNNGNLTLLAGGATLNIPSSGSIWLGGDTIIQRWNAGQVRIPSTGGLTVNGNINIEGSYSLVFGSNNLYFNVVGNNVIQTNAGLQAALGITVDNNNGNAGNMGNALRFGGGSGEGISSRRDGAGASFGVDIYTGSVIRATFGGSTGLPNSGMMLAPSYGSGNNNGTIGFYDQNHYITAGIRNQMTFGEYGAQWQFWNQQNNTTCGTVDTGGFHNGSSRKQKTAIVAVEPADCLSVVLDTRASPVHFERIGYPRAAPETGFLAEDMLIVAPEMIAFDQDGEPEGLNYANLTAYLWGAVRALHAEIQTLKGSPA